MTEDIDKNYLASLDRRITDHDNKIASAQRDHTELVHEIKELMNRINNGVSPSVNKVKDDNAEIKIQIKDLSHQMEIEMRDMKNMVRESTELQRSMLTNFQQAELGPVKADVSFMKKTFIYGVVGMVIVFVGNLGLQALWARIASKVDIPAVQERK